jgi:hypothetical protein
VKWHLVPWMILGVMLIGLVSLWGWARATNLFAEDIGGEPQVRPWARNETEVALTFETLRAGEWYGIGSLGAGDEWRVIDPDTSGLTDGGCTIGRVRAVDPSGDEVARWGREHLCSTDEVWVIGP